MYFNVDARKHAQAGGSLPSMADLLRYDDVSLDLLLGRQRRCRRHWLAVAAPVSDAAVAALGQLSGLYQSSNTP